MSAYPTAQREAAAIARDLADVQTLRDLHAIVSHALDRASRCDAIRSPARRFQTEDLIDLLAGALTDIEGEAERITRGPLVIEETE
jgi:hypothetical protein